MASEDDDAKKFQALIKEKYASKVRDALLPKAQDLAARRYRTDAKRWQFIYSFFEGYLHGLEGTSGKTTIGDGENPHQAGFDAGLSHYKKLQKSGKQTLSLDKFGYKRLEVEGLYSSVFEASDFRPANSKEKWWINFRQQAIRNMLPLMGVKRASFS
jgi:hypothetical protein